MNSYHELHTSSPHLSSISSFFLFFFFFLSSVFSFYLSSSPSSSLFFFLFLLIIFPSSSIYSFFTLFFLPSPFRSSLSSSQFFFFFFSFFFLTFFFVFKCISNLLLPPLLTYFPYLIIFLLSFLLQEYCPICYKLYPPDEQALGEDGNVTNANANACFHVSITVPYNLYHPFHILTIYFLIQFCF